MGRYRSSMAAIMGNSVDATQRARLAHPRRGLGVGLILAGFVLAVSGLVLKLFLPQPYGVAAVFLAWAGLTLLSMSLALIFTRRQFARNLGFCPSCGATTRRGTKFCTSCGSRLW